MLFNYLTTPRYLPGLVHFHHICNFWERGGNGYTQLLGKGEKWIDKTEMHAKGLCKCHKAPRLSRNELGLSRTGEDVSTGFICYPLRRVIFSETELYFSAQIIRVKSVYM
jgi:hypothetical protein